jgi:putative transferase (TIGR04331 family)
MLRPLDSSHIAVTTAQALANPNAIRMGYWVGTLSDILVDRVATAIDPLSIDQLELIYEQSTEWYLKVLPELTLALSSIHNENGLSEKSWEMIVGWWLATILDIILVRRAEAASVRKKFPAAKVEPVEWTGVLQSTGDLPSIYNDEDFNGWLHSFFLLNEVEYSEISSTGLRHIGNLQKAQMHRSLSEFVNINDAVVVSSAIGRWDRIRIAVSTFKRPSLFESLTPQTFSMETQFRVLLRSKMRSAPGFESVLADLLCRVMPISFLEAFSFFKTHALMQIPTKKKLFLGMAESTFDDSFKFACAFSKSTCGSVVIGQQHGGAYGTSKFHRGEFIEPRCCDKWLSFGWSGENITEGIRSRILSKFRREAKYIGDGDILFVLSSYPRYTYYLSALPQGPLVVPWIELTFQLADALSRQGHKVRFRIHNVDYGWELVAFARAKYPAIALEYSYERGMVQSVSSAKLVVTCANGTNMLELLSANIPTVAVLPSGFWPMKLGTKFIFDQLASAGVIHYDNESAMTQMQVMLADPLKWWKTGSVQAARRLFCEYFAR